MKNPIGVKIIITFLGHADWFLQASPLPGFLRVSPLPEPPRPWPWAGNPCRADVDVALLFPLNLRAAFLLRSSLECCAPLRGVAFATIDTTLLQP